MNVTEHRYYEIHPLFFSIAVVNIYSIYLIISRMLDLGGIGADLVKLSKFRTFLGGYVGMSEIKTLTK